MKLVPVFTKRLLTVKLFSDAIFGATFRSSSKSNSSSFLCQEITLIFTKMLESSRGVLSGEELPGDSVQTARRVCRVCL